MASSNFRKTASMSCGEADAYPAPIQADTVIQPPEEEVDPQFTRIKYMGNNARVKMILKYMWDTHRFTLSHFLYHLVTAEPEDKYDRTVNARVKKLSDAVTQKEVVEQLVNYSDDSHEVYMPMLETCFNHNTV